MNLKEKDKNGRLRIGRISRAVEKGLNLSFSGDVIVYIAESKLNEMAVSYPRNYLRLLEETENILKSPDWVAFFDQEECFVYLREYIHHGHLVRYAVSVVYEGKPRLFYFNKIWRISEEDVDSLLQSGTFARPVK